MGYRASASLMDANGFTIAPWSGGENDETMAATLALFTAVLIAVLGVFGAA